MPEPVHAFTEDALGEHDAVGIAELIRNGTVGPREVVAAAIARARSVEPTINAIVCERFDDALTDADHPNTGFFSGIPIFFKDMVDVAGMPTHNGSAAFEKTKIKTRNDPIVEQILAQGFVNLGKSAMPEFGFTCSTEFPRAYRPDTTNPWNSDHSAGGSSGGAGALVAAGVVPIAHSADGGGSTRIPAACCGAVGLKATNARIQYGALSKDSPSGITMEGVITRSVRDTAYFYAEAEKYYRNPKLDPIGLVTSPVTRRLNVAVVDESIGDRRPDAVTQRELAKTVALLESLGHSVKPITAPVPDQFVQDFIDTWALGAMLVYRFGALVFRGMDRSQVTDLTRYLSSTMTARKLLSMRTVAKRMASYQQLMEDTFTEHGIDLILSPTLAHPAIKLGEMGMDLPGKDVFERMQEWAIFTPVANASGGPAITLPLGHDDVNNLPIGMLFWARHGQDKLLLQLAYELEAAAPWKRITAGATTV
jgi:amidase